MFSRGSFATFLAAGQELRNGFMVVGYAGSGHVAVADTKVDGLRLVILFFEWSENLGNPLRTVDEVSPHASISSYVV